MEKKLKTESLSNSPLIKGPQFDSQIDCLVSYKSETFVSVSNKVHVCRRGKIVGEFEYDSEEAIFELLIYGDLLLGLSHDNSIYVWSLKTKEIYTIIDFGIDDFHLTSIVHPSTYLDKVVIGNVLGFGFLSGKIVLVNIKKDSKLLSFTQEGKVSGITFRTDLDNQAMMATSNLDGDISIWNLEKNKIVINMKGAHDGSIGGINFINGQPLLISSGQDNRIVEWVFDNYSGGDYSWPRLLKHRSGHFSNPLKVRFYGNDGKKIISSARDQTLRLFSIIRDSQSVELSQRLGGKKSKRDTRLPNIIQFAADETKQKDWDNILTCHTGLAYAPTWSMANKAIGKHELVSSDFSIIKAVSISPCGNFGYIGTLSGNVEMFNLQSGLSRKIFKVCDDLIIRVYDAESGNLVRQFVGHKNQITDLAFSPDGRWLISSSLDSTIRTWDLPTGYLIDIFKVNSVPISLDISPNFDFLVTCHADNVGLCLWTNKTLFEHVGINRVDESIAALVNVPASELGPESTAEFEDDINENSTSTDEFENVNSENGAVVDGPYMLPYQITEKALLTLSSESRSKWETLLHIDTIKKRNKPSVPAKAPESAPFFLPTAFGVEPKFETESDPNTDKKSGLIDENEDSKVKFGFSNIETEIVKLLKSGNIKGDYSEFFKYMSNQSVSGIDFEIRSISSEESLLLFTKAILWQLKRKTNFDFAQAYLNVLLNIHGDIILESIRPSNDDYSMDIDDEENNSKESIKDVLAEIKRINVTEWEKVDGLARYTMCLVDHFIV
ncbi:U3 small nucleolar RNA-associated protein 21-like protein [Smittium culicis]|uniref:U3 small nucleolar RNA-associated protein 21-like protein n=1 Tax=Smittium culicis TaxID=133412 RepID=A0A1R1Y9X1_9FUNG|nr:U3 small nucleolar RNA-associated protein 21-like protein [Smittium culicis]